MVYFDITSLNRSRPYPGEKACKKCKGKGEFIIKESKIGKVDPIIFREIKECKECLGCGYYRDVVEEGKKKRIYSCYI